MEIIKRTFEALKYPKGSNKRNELNKDSVTSEYCISYKFFVKSELFTNKRFGAIFVTKKEALKFIENFKNGE